MVLVVELVVLVDCAAVLEVELVEVEVEVLEVEVLEVEELIVGSVVDVVFVTIPQFGPHSALPPGNPVSQISPTVTRKLPHPVGIQF